MELQFKEKIYSYDCKNIPEHKYCEIPVFGKYLDFKKEGYSYDINIFIINNQKFEIKAKQIYFIDESNIPELVIVTFELNNKYSFDRALKFLSECKKVKYIILVGIYMPLSKISYDEINSVIKQYNIHSYLEYHITETSIELFKEIYFYLCEKYYNDTTNWILYETNNLIQNYSKKKNKYR